MGNLDVHVAESVVLVGLLLLSLLDVHLHVHVGGHVLVLGQEGGAVGGLLVCSSWVDNLPRAVMAFSVS